MRVTVTYDRFTHKASKTVPCEVCGKKVRRQRTFEQTQNPFNRNENGEPKTIPEIYASLRGEADVWMSEPESCTACKPDRG